MLSGRSVVQTGRRKVPPASDDLGVPSRWVEVHSLHIHYKCLGKGQPVILIHGSANDWHEWQENICHLACYFRVYAPDMPGFGLSQPVGVPMSLPWSVRFLNEFMEVVGVQRAHLVGHSLGGMVALSLALSLPERVLRLALIDSLGLGEVNRKARLSLYLIRGARKLITKERTPRLAYTPRKDRLFLSRLPSLIPRTMLIWGQRDRYLPPSQAELAHALIPDSELHVFPDCGHAPQRERPKEFNRLICQFFSSPD